MDGFDREQSTGNCQNKSTCAYGYVPQSESQPYLDLATQYAFGDNMFGTNEGPSFPAHQYLISGTSTVAAKRLATGCRKSVQTGRAARRRRLRRAVERTRHDHQRIRLRR